MAGQEKKMLTVVKLADVNGEPKVKLDLPGPLRVGDPLGLRFKVERQSNGRREVLEVDGQFRVEAVGFDNASIPAKQLLSVASATKPPVWRSVKSRKTASRRLSPAVSPRTPI